MGNGAEGVTVRATSGLTRINILLPCGKSGKYWGEYHFGASLKAAFDELGIPARIIYRPQRKFLAALSLRRGIDLHIRGPKTHLPRIWPWVRTAIWLISYFDLTKTESNKAEHIFSASQTFAETLTGKGLSASFLMQCTDRNRFSPDKAQDNLKTDVLFVGSQRKLGSRPMVSYALAADLNIAVWGTGWDGHIPDTAFRGKFIKNEDLGGYYASAALVLNDHLPSMLTHNAVSNRVFDVLASGSELVTDQKLALEIPLPSVQVANSQDEFAEAIRNAREKSDSRVAQHLEIAVHIREHHSFHSRVTQILTALTKTRNDHT